MATKPTVDEIKELYERCVTYYSECKRLFEEDEKYYELQFKDELGMPIEFTAEGIVLPTGRDMVDTCVDHTDVHNARVFVNRKGTSPTTDIEAEMMRKFYTGLISRTEQEATISPWRVGAKHYWLHGVSYFKTVWDADRSPDKPEQKKGESEESYAERIDSWRSESGRGLPIVIQAVHPKNVMFDPFGNDSFVFETQERLRYNVSLKWPSWSNPKDKRAGDTVQHISFWTPEYRCELYDGEPVFKVSGGVVKHKYGFLPYVAIDSGLGNLSADSDPKKRYVGVLRYIRNLLISESRNYSTSDCVLKRTAWPWGTIEGDNAESVQDVSQQFGTYTRLPKGTKLVQQTPQVPAGDLMNHLSLTGSYLAAHAAPNSVRGMGETGVRSGTDRRQLIAEASMKYQYGVIAFRNGTAKVLTNCARLMKNVIPGDIRVWAKTPTDEFDMEIDKSKMKEPFTCYVEFAPVSEEDEYTRHDDLERLTASGIVTKKWARTQMSNIDPQSMELQEEIEKLKNSPAVSQVMDQYLAGKLTQILGTVQQIGALKDEQKNPETANPPRGQTPMYNIPTPGSAEGMQNEMAGLRSPTSMTQQGQGGGGNR